MGYKRFNRYELFNKELMAFHSQTIRNVESFLWETKKEFNNEVTNMLSGIWDGYLYDSLLEDAKALNLPYEDLVRIETTIKLIEEEIEKKGESITPIY